MRQKATNSDLIVFLKQVQANKNLLFGKFSAPNGDVTKKAKTETWTKIRDECLAKGNKSWANRTAEFMRDNIYGVNKSRTLKKRDRFKKSGSDGGTYTEVSIFYEVSF